MGIVSRGSAGRLGGLQGGQGLGNGVELFWPGPRHAPAQPSSLVYKGDMPEGFSIGQDRPTMTIRSFRRCGAIGDSWAVSSCQQVTGVEMPAS